MENERGRIRVFKEKPYPKLASNPPKCSQMITSDLAAPLTGLDLKEPYKPSPCLCLYAAKTLKFKGYLVSSRHLASWLVCLLRTE